jgi:uncharacterized protein YneF (UPF0154 family)
MVSKTKTLTPASTTEKLPLVAKVIAITTGAMLGAYILRKFIDYQESLRE